MTENGKSAQLLYSVIKKHKFTAIQVAAAHDKMPEKVTSWNFKVVELFLKKLGLTKKQIKEALVRDV